MCLGVVVAAKKWRIERGKMRSCPCAGTGKKSDRTRMRHLRLQRSEVAESRSRFTGGAGLQQQQQIIIGRQQVVDGMLIRKNREDRDSESVPLGIGWMRCWAWLLIFIVPTLLAGFGTTPLGRLPGHHRACSLRPFGIKINARRSVDGAKIIGVNPDLQDGVHYLTST